jgi:tRNA nucleotidyltransferase/poly(A) polymerase
VNHFPGNVSAKIAKLDIIRRMRVLPFKGDVYLVGGAVREVALNQAPHDYDLALQNLDDLKPLEDLLGRPSFILGKKPIQTRRIVSREVCLDITFLDTTIEADLVRRDFTVNAMAYDIRTGSLLDPLNGLRDIRQRVLRYPRRESIASDPLRMIKAIRHLATLKGFSLDQELESAITMRKALIRQVAPERVKYELDLIFASENVNMAVEVMRLTGLLFEIVPELLALKALDEEKGFVLETLGHTMDGFRYLKRARRWHTFSRDEVRHVAYAFLFHDLGKAYTFSYDETKGKVHFFYHERRSREIAESIMERLRFSSSDVRIISALIEAHMRLFLISHEGATEKATRRVVYKMGELVRPLVLLTLLDMYGSSGGKDNQTTRQVRKRCKEVLSALEDWKREPLPRIITGDDLLGMGVGQGPFIGKILEEVREKQIAGEIVDKAQALDYASKMIKVVDREQ